MFDTNITKSGEAIINEVLIMENKNNYMNSKHVANEVDNFDFNSEIEEIRMGCGTRFTKQTTLRMQSTFDDEIAV